jgi:hypothetical protein
MVAAMLKTTLKARKEPSKPKAKRGRRGRKQTGTATPSEQSERETEIASNLREVLELCALARRPTTAARGDSDRITGWSDAGLNDVLRRDAAVEVHGSI